NRAQVLQRPSLLRTCGASRETRLVNAEVLEYFDIRALEVLDELDVDDGRFSVAIVEAGAGRLEGDFGTVEVARGATFALPASLPHSWHAGGEPLRVLRCLGPDPLRRGVPGTAHDSSVRASSPRASEEGA
ncbi:MAG TPA: hypothetical protein VMD59_22035, partial [Acidimicrobiales bacterium]|nr:hypothetical protein [Acidimicrobiales bacterium]